MKKPFVPRACEIVMIDFSPTRGHEQAQLRPAIVLSGQGYNDRAGLLVCVPCTRTIRGYPFEVRIASLPEPGVALADQLRTLDWRERETYSLGIASESEMLELRAKIKALLGIS